MAVRHAPLHRSYCTRFDRMTKDGREMGSVQKLLAKAVAAITGKKEERAVASLFSSGGIPCC